MNQFIREIIRRELAEDIHSVKAIEGLGCVNAVYEVSGKKADYIIRLNQEQGKQLEYQKEQWCLEQVAALGIPSPGVIKTGMYKNIPFMIQKKLPGLNGKYSNAQTRTFLWKSLGTYAAGFHQIKRIEVPELERSNFHKDWKSRLLYNLEELNDADSLLAKKVFSQSEQKRAKAALLSLMNKNFKTGLVHGDLSPRNVLIHHNTVYLLDWGTAEINIVPHNEIGILQISKEASEEEFHLFLSGLGISDSSYQRISKEIRIINLLHRLDKYRWAEGHGIENIEDYEMKVKAQFEELD